MIHLGTYSRTNSYHTPERHIIYIRGRISTLFVK
jgi:hypothetical protein